MVTPKWLLTSVALAAFTILGCDSDDNGAPPVDTPTPVATATAVPTATTEPVPTATPDEIDDHVEVEIGSSEDGGGQLVAEFDFSEVIPLFFTQCFGGSDEECTGGQSLFSAPNPGFEGHHEHAEESDAAPQGAEEGLFPLVETTQVTIEIVAIDAGLSLRFGEVSLDTAGDSALLGTGAEFHQDGESLLLIDGHPSDAIYSLTFRLSADSGYGDSAEYTLLYQASEEEHHEEEEREHEHE